MCRNQEWNRVKGGWRHWQYNNSFSYVCHICMNFHFISSLISHPWSISFIRIRLYTYAHWFIWIYLSNLWPVIPFCHMLHIFTFPSSSFSFLLICIFFHYFHFHLINFLSIFIITQMAFSCPANGKKLN